MIFEAQLTCNHLFVSHCYFSCTSINQKFTFVSLVHRPIARVRRIPKSPALVRTNWALCTPFFRPRGCSKCSNFCSTWQTTTITTTLTAPTTTTEAHCPVLILRSCSISCNNTICWINSRWVNLNLKFCLTWFWPLKSWPNSLSKTIEWEWLRF